MTSIDVSISAPAEVESGEEVEVDALVSVSGNDEALDVAVRFAVDDSVLAEETASIEESERFTFAHTFSSSGERELYVGASAVVDGEEVRAVEDHTLVVADDDGGTEERIEREDGADVSRELIESGGWEVTDESQQRFFEEQYGLVMATGDAYTTIYEEATLRADVTEMTLGDVDAPLSTFFTTRIDFSPPIENLPGDEEGVIAEVEENAKERFRDQLSDNGLDGIAEATTRTMTVETGEAARVTDYEATFPVPDTSLSIAGGRSVDVEGGEVPVAGLLAVWHDGRNVFVAGGAYPAANYEKEVERTITEAIRITIVIDLGLTPTAYEEELVRLVQSVA